MKFYSFMCNNIFQFEKISNKFHVILTMCYCCSVAKSCLTLGNPMDYTVHGILQAKMEWVAFPFPRGSSQPRDWTQVFHNAGRFFTSWATRETQEFWSG